MNSLIRLFAVLFCLPLIACGSDEMSDNNSAECEAGFVKNPVSGGCDPLRTVGADAATNNISPADDGGTGQPDAGTPDRDGGGDAGEPCIDNDGDGVCAEDDCDDDNIAVAPGIAEICDGLDNDCNDEVNDGLDCGFYAHTNEALYFLDPFSLTADKIVDTPTTLLDIDTHPDGRLFGILSTPLTLAVFDETTLTFQPLPNELGAIGNANGMAISNTGRIFISSSGNLYTADLTTGVSSLIGSYAPFISSGDVVVTKGDNLLMTSSHTSPDTLIRLDGNTGTGTSRGAIGVDAIWGLTAAYGLLYGVTSSGELAVIDATTGAGEVVHTFDGLSFYGAASTPDR